MIELLLTAMLLGIGSGAFALFLDSCMDEGMIFHWWYKILDSVKSEELKYWCKPLGLCVYCLSEWVFIVLLYVLYQKIAHTFPQFIVLFVVGSGFNFLIVDLWVKKVQ